MKAIFTPKISVFVSSSDNTYDVFQVISTSLVKAFGGDSVNYYVGLNKHTAPSPFFTIKSPVQGWKDELLYQINQLPPDVDYLILMLDDFFFHEKVEIEKVNNFYDFVVKNKIDYLRLVPLQRSFLIRLIKSTFIKYISKSGVEKIQQNEPYYSSLQASIWRRSYLEELLNNNVSIWGFEHLVLDDRLHYAVCTAGLMNYEHLVEKGKWLNHAQKLLPLVDKAYFLKRGYDSRFLYKYKFFRHIKFNIYGYSAIKIKSCIADFCKIITGK